MGSIFRTFIRVCNLMLHPGKEWKEIAEENHNRKTVYLRFVLPLLCLMAIASVIGTWLSVPRDVYSATYVLYHIARLWASLSAGLYLSAFLITEIMANQVGSRNHNRSFSLMAYSSGAAYLSIIVVALFPFFNELIVLAFYSCYLYWQGIPYLIQVDDQKRMMYGLLSLIIVALTYFLMFFFFDNILKALMISNF